MSVFLVYGQKGGMSVETQRNNKPFKKRFTRDKVKDNWVLLPVLREERKEDVAACQPLCQIGLSDFY